MRNGFTALACILLIGCSQHSGRSAFSTPPSNAAEIQRRCWGAGNDGVRLWRCATVAERKGMTGLVIDWQEQNGPKTLRVLSRWKDRRPFGVEDVRSGFRGTVDYNAAFVVSSDDENGWRMVPLRGSGGRRGILVWRMDGEFDVYQGLRRL
jgi:hypothetical protein